MLITEPLPNQMLRPSLRYLAYILGQHWTSPLQEQSCLTSMSKMFTYIRLHYINDSLGLQPMLLIRSATSTASLSADMSSCLPSIHLSSHLSIYCWFFHPSICLSCLSVPSPFCFFMHSSFCPFIHPSIRGIPIFIHPSVLQPVIPLPVVLSFHPSVCSSICHPLTDPFVLQFIHLIFSLSIHSLVHSSVFQSILLHQRCAPFILQVLTFDLWSIRPSSQLTFTLAIDPWPFSMFSNCSLVCPLVQHPSFSPPSSSPPIPPSIHPSSRPSVHSFIRSSIPTSIYMVDRSHHRQSIKHDCRYFISCFPRQQSNVFRLCPYRWIKSPALPLSCQTPSSSSSSSQPPSPHSAAPHAFSCWTLFL